MNRDVSFVALLTFCLFVGPGCRATGALAPAGDPLPGSLKGYELYSWTDAGQTWFTLLPGTNRVKTPDEVFASERDAIDPSGMFAVTFAGLEAAGGQLARLPRSASILARTVGFPSGTALESIGTPEPVASALRADATALGLDLQIVQ